MNIYIQDFLISIEESNDSIVFSFHLFVIKTFRIIFRYANIKLWNFFFWWTVWAITFESSLFSKQLYKFEETVQIMVVSIKLTLAINITHLMPEKSKKSMTKSF